MQGSRPVHLHGIDIGLLLQQRAEGGSVAVHQASATALLSPGAYRPSESTSAAKYAMCVFTLPYSSASLPVPSPC